MLLSFSTAEKSVTVQTEKKQTHSKLSNNDNDNNNNGQYT